MAKATSATTNPKPTAVPPPAPAPAPGEKKDKLPIARSLEVTFHKLANKLKKLGESYGKLEDPKAAEVSAKIADVHVALRLAPAGVVPDTAVRKKKVANTPASIEIGSIVGIKEARRENYEGLLQTEELIGMKVLGVKGNKVLVQTTAGTKVFISTNDVGTSSAS